MTGSIGGPDDGEWLVKVRNQVPPTVLERVRRGARAAPGGPGEA